MPGQLLERKGPGFAPAGRRLAEAARAAFRTRRAFSDKLNSLQRLPAGRHGFIDVCRFTIGNTIGFVSKILVHLQVHDLQSRARKLP